MPGKPVSNGEETPHEQPKAEKEPEPQQYVYQPPTATDHINKKLLETVLQRMKSDNGEDPFAKFMNPEPDQSSSFDDSTEQ